MDTDLIEKTVSSEQVMIELGQEFGSQLTGGDIVELVGDVGAGKTTFVKGIAKALNIKEKIQSPSFTISRQYEGVDKRGDKIELVHYDFYRMESAGIVVDEVEDVVSQTNTIVVTEWAEAVDDINFSWNRYVVNFKIKSESVREVKIKHYLAEDNLIKGKNDFIY